MSWRVENNIITRRSVVLYSIIAVLISCASEKGQYEKNIAQEDSSLHSSLVAFAIEFRSGEPTDDQLISSDKTWWSTETAGVLDYNLHVIDSNPGVRFEVLGFADENECLHYDCRKLSLLRAQLIYKWLIDNGVSEEILVKPVGLGAEMAIDDNETEQGRRRNRRVEINILP